MNNNSLDGIDEIFKEAGTPYSVVGLNGRIIQGTISTKIIEDLFLALIRKITSLGIGVYLFNFPYVIYKITSNCVIFMHTKIGKTAFTSLASQIMEQYGPVLDEILSQTPLNISDLVKAYIFSMNRINGPEAIASYVPISEGAADAVTEFKVSMNSMMILANQTIAEKRDILTFLPLLETNDLGMVYLFKIPLVDARGGAYDSSITAVIDYDYRDLIYRYNDRLEHVFKQISEDFKSFFVNLYGTRIDDPIHDRAPFEKILEQFHGMLSYISIKPITNEPLKDRMFDAVNEFQKFFSK